MLAIWTNYLINRISLRPPKSVVQATNSLSILPSTPITVMPIPSPPPTANKRRLACERCRTQKLKCNRRSESASEPCLRCAQAREECIISLRKTPGRPAGRANNATRESHSHDPSLEPTEPIDAHFDSSATSVVAFDDAFDGQFDFTMDNGTDPTSLLPSITNFEFPESIFSSLEPATDFSMSSWDSTLDDPRGPRVSRRQSFPMLEQNADPGFQLSCLHQKLSKQLFMLKSLSWDIPSVLKLESGPCSNGCHSRLASRTRREFNPLTSTFSIVSELEHVLNTFKRLPAHTTTPTALGLRQGMNVSHSLTAMSCYLQLIFIYDCIISYVLEQASSNLLVRDFVLHSTPPVSLGGFLIPAPPNMVGRLLVQLMQLRMKPIEAALGLPRDVRISGEADGETNSEAGLLGGKQGESLLMALKESGIGDGNDISAAGAIDSLKEKIERLESFQ